MRHKVDKSWRLTPKTFPLRLHLQDDMRYLETRQPYGELTSTNPPGKIMREYLPLFPLIFFPYTYYFNPHTFIPRKISKNHQSDSTITVLIPPCWSSLIHFRLIGCLLATLLLFHGSVTATEHPNTSHFRQSPPQVEYYHGIPRYKHFARLQYLLKKGYRPISLSSYGPPHDALYSAIGLIAEVIRFLMV